MKDYFKLLPAKYLKWYYFALFGFIMGQIANVITLLVAGNGYRPIPLSPYDQGAFLSQSVIWIVGSLIIFWWYFVREGQEKK